MTRGITLSLLARTIKWEIHLTTLVCVSDILLLSSIRYTSSQLPMSTNVEITNRWSTFEDIPIRVGIQIGGSI